MKRGNWRNVSVSSHGLCDVPRDGLRHLLNGRETIQGGQRYRVQSSEALVQDV